MSELLSHLVRTRGAGPDQGPSPAAALHVEVIADLVCPFCYIGKRRFDQAMQAVQGPSDISWYPYQLNPDMPEEGMSLHDYLSMRFGSPANVEPVLQQLAADACQEDIDFRFDRIEHVSGPGRNSLSIPLSCTNQRISVKAYSVPGSRQSSGRSFRACWLIGSRFT